jgi:iron complex transport system ATP-binding protein
MDPESAPGTLRADRLVAGYGGAPALHEIDLAIPDGHVTAIVGPNGCGKSTLLRTLARLLKPDAGSVVLDGRDIRARPTREVAQRIGILPQGPVAPEGLTVEDLVARGRFPHQGWVRRWSADDDAHVERALAATGTAVLRHRPVDQLSGGQRQRVWIAMTLAQDTATLLLDEPTTFLDLAHQVEVLDLLRDLNRRAGRTIVMVLHDLNDAARYADHVVALRDGVIVAAGEPRDVITEPTVERVFGLRCRVLTDPEAGTPLVVPARRVAGEPASADAPEAYVVAGR